MFSCRKKFSSSEIESAQCGRAFFCAEPLFDSFALTTGLPLSRSAEAFVDGLPPCWEEIPTAATIAIAAAVPQANSCFMAWSQSWGKGLRIDTAHRGDQ